MHNLTEVTIFVAFLGLQAGFQGMHRLHDSKLIRWLSDRHYLVWLMHPSVVHGVQDYVIHFVVYSGKVIAAH